MRIIYQKKQKTINDILLDTERLLKLIEENEKKLSLELESLPKSVFKDRKYHTVGYTETVRIYTVKNIYINDKLPF